MVLPILFAFITATPAYQVDAPVSLRFKPAENEVLRYRFDEKAFGMGVTHRIGLLETRIVPDPDGENRWKFTTRVAECEFLPTPLFQDAAVRRHMDRSFVGSTHEGTIDDRLNLLKFSWSENAIAAVFPAGLQAYGPLGVVFPSVPVRVGEGWQTSIDGRLASAPEVQLGARTIEARLVKLEGDQATIEWQSRYTVTARKPATEFVESGRVVVAVATGVPDRLLLTCQFRTLNGGSSEPTLIEVRMQRAP